MRQGLELLLLFLLCLPTSLHTYTRSRDPNGLLCLAQDRWEIGKLMTVRPELTPCLEESLLRARKRLLEVG